MAHDVISTTDPTDLSALSDGDDAIRDYKIADMQRMALDHTWTGTNIDTTIATADGFHKKVSFLDIAAHPTPFANQAILYSKKIGSYAQLHETRHGSGSTFNAVVMPVGCVVPYAGSTAPDGWFICNGQALNKLAYAALYAAIGDAYKVGVDVDTFNVPNLVGRVPVGLDASSSVITSGRASSLGETSGSETHVMSLAEMPAHTHSVDTYAAGFGGLVNGAVHQGGPIGVSTGVAGSSNAHENMQPSIALNYIIKA